MQSGLKLSKSKVVRNARMSSQFNREDSKSPSKNENLKFEMAEANELFSYQYKKLRDDHSAMSTEEPMVSSKHTTQESLNCINGEDVMVSEFTFGIQDEDEPDSISELMRSQLLYEEFHKQNPNFLDGQMHMKPHMVPMLLDWVMEVSQAFQFRRETFYLAHNYIERYLSIDKSVQISKLQLLGITSLFIAQKCEELYPKKLADFLKTADNQYNAQDIEAMELQILRVLEYRMNPNTPILWLNYFLKVWDDFIGFRVNDMTFRNKTENDYKRYRELLQIFDCSMMDYTNKVDHKVTSLCLLYLVCGKQVGEFPEPAYISQYAQSNTIYNQLFAQFLGESQIYFDFNTRIQYDDLHPYIQGFVKYFMLQLDFQLPPIFRSQIELFHQLPYEDVLSYQTHNVRTLSMLTYLNNTC